MRIFQLANSSR